MDQEEYRAIVINIGRAFQKLPDLRSQIDVLASLTKLVMNRPKYNLAVEWLNQAEGALRGSALVIKDGDEGGAKL